MGMYLITQYANREKQYNFYLTRKEAFAYGKTQVKNKKVKSLGK